MLKFKTDVLKLLKDAGYSTYRLRKEKIIGEATIQRIREYTIPSLDNLDWLCATLQLQPEDLVEYVDE